MSDLPVALLVVPTEGSKMLDNGPFGSRPPMACKAASGDPWELWCGDVEEGWCSRALILAWDSKLDRHGCLTLADHCGQAELGAGAAQFQSICGDVQEALMGSLEYLQQSISSEYPGDRLVVLRGVPGE